MSGWYFKLHKVLFIISVVLYKWKCQKSGRVSINEKSSSLHGTLNLTDILSILNISSYCFLRNWACLPASGENCDAPVMFYSGPLLKLFCSYSRTTSSYCGHDEQEGWAHWAEHVSHFFFLLALPLFKWTAMISSAYASLYTHLIYN